MATEVLVVSKLSSHPMTKPVAAVHETLKSSADAVIHSAVGRDLQAQIAEIRKQISLPRDELILVRLGASSVKDTYAMDLPSTKPLPMLRLWLSCGRV
jgi:hypothetical protein